MAKSAALEELWNSAPPAQAFFDPPNIAQFPEPVRRYLMHAIARGTPLASAVRIRMHGEIKLKRWYPFSAEQVTCWPRGFIWQAVMRMGALTVSGSDRFVDGHGAMRWKFFGVVPLITASGLDITRSAAGRVNIECIWLPAVLCGEKIAWSALDDSHIRASFTAHGESAAIDLAIDPSGAPTSVRMPRWGNPEGSLFHYAEFGGFLENEATFSGYTIPTRLRVGWHFGSSDFEPEGEFFRAAIDSATYK